jgi:pimeloyl-ACP methyl ester carboxylesterase
LEHAVRIARSWREDMDELKSHIRNAADIPILVIWGSKDRLVDLASAQAICENFRTARTVIIEGAGHLPYEEVPEQFCPPVLDFLETYSSAQGIDGK